MAHSSKTPPRRRRKRPGEVNCSCTGYPFPHRFLGGNCTGEGFVVKYFEEQIFGECRDCHYRAENEDEDDWRGRGRVTCQVIDGLEPSIKCPGLMDYVNYEGIKLYGPFKDFSIT